MSEERKMILREILQRLLEANDVPPWTVDDEDMAKAEESIFELFGKTGEINPDD